MTNRIVMISNIILHDPDHYFYKYFFLSFAFHTFSRLRFTLLIFFIFYSVQTLIAQVDSVGTNPKNKSSENNEVVLIADTIAPKQKKELKNTISYNVTNTLIFGGKAQVLCYERVVGKTQTVAIEFGTFSFPGVKILSGNLRENEEQSQKGYKLAFDYRFYPAKENKYNAPRGVYVGPYISYNYFNRTKSFDINTAETGVPVEVTVGTDFTFQTFTGGLQLGYQFVFWRRLAIDLVLIGPGITKYKVEATLDTSLDPDEESELFEALNEKLEEKIPGYSYIVNPVDFKKTGSTNTTSIGFRYLIHIGFRF
jgi:hypothetical protein